MSQINLTICIPFKNDFCLANSLDVVFNELDLETPDIPVYRSHVHFPVPRLLQRIKLGSKLLFCNMQILYGEEFLALPQSQSCRTIPFQLYMTVHSVYTQ